MKKPRNRWTLKELRAAGLKPVPLAKCRVCGAAPDIGLYITKEQNPMYVFNIKHSCGGFEQRHLSLFCQNETPPEKCLDTLRKGIAFYSDGWNRRHKKEG